MSDARLPKNFLGIHLLGRLLAWLTGWRVAGELPPVSRAVVIAAPHESYWDGFYMLIVSAVLRVRIALVVKDTAYIWPLSLLLWAFGAIPVNRTSPKGVVETLAARIRERAAVALAISPPGTRARREHCKSGFYRIALAADVPIVCSYLDYARKEGGVGPVLTPTGDIGADMVRVREFYDGVTPCYPGLKKPVRLREEEVG